MRHHEPARERPSSAEDAFALLLRLREEGRAPPFESWVREFPEWEDELRTLHDSWDLMDRQLAQVLQPASGTARRAAAPELKAGMRVGEFELQRYIDKGGMGEVWLARQEKLNRSVALKFIRSDRVTPQSVAFFDREARAAGRVNDPRIVTVFATGTNAGQRWMAQEYVPGGRSLGTWLADLRAAGPLPADHDRRMASFFAEVAEALHAAHELDVVHRDLKPQNILIAKDGSPKVADFGLARLIDESALSDILSIKGTVEYMSPEQVDGRSTAIDRRSDVFALGTVLFEALTLRRPFAGNSTAEVLGRITLSDPPAPAALRPQVSGDLAVIALKALEKRPADRYATAAELAAELRRWLAHEPILTRPPTPLQRARKWMRRHPTATVAAAATLLLVLAGWALLAGIAQRDARLLAQQKEQHVLQALWDIDNGRLDDATAQLASFAALDPGDPEGHLVLAMGYVRFLRVAEAQQELRRAAELGFDPTLAAAASARDCYLRALYLMAQADAGLYEEAAGLLAEAIRRDERFAYAWFPLYQMRRNVGDLEGAGEALRQFKQTLRFGDDIVFVVDALQAELAGDPAGAVEHLEALRAEVGPERLDELRAYRHLGRNYLELYWQVQGGGAAHLLDEAEANLRQAVAGPGEDGSSWAALGLVQILRMQQETGAGEREARRAQAEADAEMALQTGLGRELAREVLARVAHDRVAHDFAVRRTDEGLLDDLERRLDDLREAEPENPLLPAYSGDLAYYRGAFASARGDSAAARGYWADSVSADDRQLYARVCLAQRQLEETQDYAAAEELLEQALALWDARLPKVPGWDPSEPATRKWLFATTVWLFGAADRNGSVELARRALARTLEELAGDPEGAHPNELVTLAEFLATPRTPELRDCARALELLETYDLEAEFAGNEAARPTLEAILEACANQR